MVGRSAQRGVTFLALLIVVAVVSAVLAASAQVISHAIRREREKQLLWVGDQFRRALLEYSKVSAGVDTFPRELSDLLEDKRQAVKRSHLRRVYFDPMTASTDWGLIRNAQQRIIGVHSKSTLTPIRTDNFPPAYAAFRKATTYADWKFALGDLPPAGAPAGGAPAKPGATPGLPPGDDGVEVPVAVPGTPAAPGSAAPGAVIPASPAAGPAAGAASPGAATPGVAAPKAAPGFYSPGILSPLPNAPSPLSPASPAGGQAPAPTGAAAPGATGPGAAPAIRGRQDGSPAAVTPAVPAVPAQTPAPAPVETSPLPPGDDAAPEATGEPETGVEPAPAESGTGESTD